MVFESLDSGGTQKDRCVIITLEASRMERREIELRGEYVELNKLLKFENIVASGGEAKQLIASGAVSVDGEVESRIRRKLVAGNLITLEGIEFLIKSKDG